MDSPESCSSNRRCEGRARDPHFCQPLAFARTTIKGAVYLCAYVAFLFLLYDQQSCVAPHVAPPTSSSNAMHPNSQSSAPCSGVEAWWHGGAALCSGMEAWFTSHQAALRAVPISPPSSLISQVAAKLAPHTHRLLPLLFLLLTHLCLGARQP